MARTKIRGSMSDLIWVEVPGFKWYVINQYGDVRYADTNMPLQWTMGLGEKWYSLLNDGVVYLRSHSALLKGAFPNDLG
jgi:hypothetical protein